MGELWDINKNDEGAQASNKRVQIAVKPEEAKGSKPLELQ